MLIAYTENFLIGCWSRRLEQRWECWLTRSTCKYNNTYTYIGFKGFACHNTDNCVLILRLFSYLKRRNSIFPQKKILWSVSERSRELRNGSRNFPFLIPFLSQEILPLQLPLPCRRRSWQARPAQSLWRPWQMPSLYTRAIQPWESSRMYAEQPRRSGSFLQQSLVL